MPPRIPPERSVLAAYRHARRTGLPPLEALHHVRSGYAGTIAADVAAGRQPDPADVDCWRAADQYLAGLHRRPLWWFQGAPPVRAGSARS